MTWLLVLVLAAAYLALMLRIAYWIGALLAQAQLLVEREIEPVRCSCRKGAVCAKCLAESESIRRTAA